MTEGTRHFGHAMTRRQFLQVATALFASTGAAALLGGCGSPQQPAAPASSAGSTPAAKAPAATAAPQGGQAASAKTLTIALDAKLYGVNDSWLPNRADSVSNNPRAAIYDHLLMVDPKDQFKLAPGLAEFWTDKDSKEFTFKLRKGVNWQKGQGEVTADDVAYSLKLITQADSKAIDGAYWRARIDKMKVVDPSTLSFSFDTIQPDLLNMLSAQSHQIVVSKKYVDSVGQDKADLEPVGSGPYQMDSQVPGSEFSMVPAGPSHWRGNPKWGKIRVLKMPEATTRLALLDSGRADVVAISLEQIEEARGKGYKIIPSDSVFLYAIDFGGLFNKSHALYTGKEPWHDIRVREAMNLAIDRAALNKTFFAGLGVIDNVMGNAVASPATTTGPLTIPYDPERAKALLKEAGYAQGFEVNMVSYDIAALPNPNVIQAVAASWEAIGLKPKIQPSDFATFRSHLLKDETNGLMYGWANDLRIAAQSRFEKFFYSKSLGFGIYYDDQLDSMYETMMKTLDASQREKILADAMVYLRKQWAAVPIVSCPQSVFAVNPKTVAGWDPVWRNTASNFEYVIPA